MENNNLENQNVVENNNQNQTINIDYDKLDNIINKGKDAKENSILKSFFQQNGIENEDELKKAIATYKENSRKQEEEQKNKYLDIENQNKELLKQLKQEKYNNSLKDVVNEFGLDSKSAKAVEKLAELNIDELFENDNINTDKIKESINKVLEEYPQFKKSTNNNKIVEVGSPDSNLIDDSNEKLRKAFGLK